MSNQANEGGNILNDYIDYTASTTKNDKIKINANELFKEYRHLLNDIEERNNFKILEAKLKEKEGVYEQDVQKFETIYQTFTHKSESIVRKENQDEIERYQQINQNLRKLEESIDSSQFQSTIMKEIKGKIQRIDQTNANLKAVSEDMDIILMNLAIKSGRNFIKLYQTYKQKKFKLVLIPKILYLFWSLIVFTIGIDYAFEPIENKVLRIVALVIVWLLLTFYLTPKLDKYVEREKYENLKKVFNDLYVNKILLICGIDLYQYYLV